MEKAKRWRYHLCTTLLLFLFCLLALPASAAGYDASAAATWAKANYTKSYGLCAEFVWNCLANGGGYSVSKTTSATQLRKNLLATGDWVEYSPTLYSKIYMRQADNSGKISVGDVVMYRYTGDTSGKPYCHTALITDFANYNSVSNAAWITQRNSAYHGAISAGYTRCSTHSSGYCNSAICWKKGTIAVTVLHYVGSSTPISPLNFGTPYSLSVSETSATIRVDVTKNSNNMSQVGAYWGTDPNNLSNQSYDNGGTSSKIYYDLSGLNPGTTYYFKFYVKDTSGNMFWSDVASFTTSGTLPSPVISDITVTDVSHSGYTVNCRATCDGGIDRVMFPTWTEYNGQDDLLSDWGTNSACRGTLNSDGSYSFRVTTSAHNNESGCYITHIYAYSTYGTYTAKGNSVTIGHNWAAQWSSDGVAHWHECLYSDCPIASDYSQKDGYAVHTWNDGTVTKAATCAATGVKTYTCTVCGKTKTETIAKTATHTWNSGKVTKAATCAATGVKTYTCTVCGATKTETIAKTTSHTWNSGKVTKAATCAATGVKTYTCTVCGATKTETIAKTTSHTWNSGKVTKAATCAATGVKTYTCTVCGATKTETIAKTTNHTWNSGKTTKNPTATTAGEKTYTCTVCGTTKTEEIPATGQSGKGNVKISLASTSSTYQRGDTFTVNINMDENPGIIAASMYIKYDESVLSLNSITNKDVCSAEDGFSLSHTKGIEESLASGTLLIWGGAITNTTQCGIMAELSFTVLDDAELDETEISITFPADEAFTDSALQVVGAQEVTPLKIDITDVLLGDVNRDGKVTLRDWAALRLHLSEGEGENRNNIDLVAADVTCDGKVTIRDWAALRLMLSAKNS